MINFTDITGLASSTVAILALTVHLPGVARLHKPYLLLLMGIVAVAVLVPFGGLPLAAYVRGATGDLSVASLVLLLMSILRPLCGRTPGGQFNASTRCMSEEGRLALLLLVALAAAALYPMALGLGLFDPYRLGYGNPWLLGGLLLLALTAVFRRLPLVALTVALAVFAWSVGWYESGNLWDYLLDPLLAIYAIGALLKRAVQSCCGPRRV